jgi:hypothetical protein
LKLTFYSLLYLFSVQIIHKKDTEYCQHSVHTDSNKVMYIKAEVPNIIIKTAKLHNSGLKYVATDKSAINKQLWVRRWQDKTSQITEYEINFESMSRTTIYTQNKHK